MEDMTTIWSPMPKWVTVLKNLQWLICSDTDLKYKYIIPKQWQTNEKMNLVHSNCIFNNSRLYSDWTSDISPSLLTFLYVAAQFVWKGSIMLFKHHRGSPKLHLSYVGRLWSSVDCGWIWFRREHCPRIFNFFLTLYSMPARIFF